jgi:hypothetical protein
MVLPMIIGSEKTIMEKLVTNDLAWGIFIGLILVMVVYNFFIWLSVKRLQLFLLCLLQFICRAHAGNPERIHLSFHPIRFSGIKPPQYYSVRRTCRSDGKSVYDALPANQGEYPQTS